jgi:hypothetical protein
MKGSSQVRAMHAPVSDRTGRACRLGQQFSERAAAANTGDSEDVAALADVVPCKVAIRSDIPTVAVRHRSADNDATAENPAISENGTRRGRGPRVGQMGLAILRSLIRRRPRERRAITCTTVLALIAQNFSARSSSRRSRQSAQSRAERLHATGNVSRRDLSPTHFAISTTARCAISASTAAKQRRSRRKLREKQSTPAYPLYRPRSSCELNPEEPL